MSVSNSDESFDMEPMPPKTECPQLESPPKQITTCNYYCTCMNSVVLLFLIGFYALLGLGPSRYTIETEGESWMY